MSQHVAFAAFLFSLASSLPLPAASPTAEFQTLAKHRSNTVRVDPAADWAGYRSFLLKPAVYGPAKPKSKLTPQQQEKIRAAVDTSLRTAFPGTANPGGHVLEVRPVITNVRRANPFVNAISFAAVQAPVSYGAASVRYELFDAETGAQVGEIASSRCAGPWNIYPWQMLQAFQPVAHASTILKRDSKMLRKDLDKMARTPVEHE